ncbi:MAG: DUF4249 family protein [Ignavibacteriae bacterium]|nr:DUF4249 family protein [Ignavibacteriota bacterium]NOG96413.1 DUF4249 family protein [Ignavibacteriota bacterium]
MRKGSALIFILSFLIACENIDLIEIEIDFVEQVVVRADLVKDSLFQGVAFTKTLPLKEEYQIEKAELTNVIAYLKVNYTQIIPLHYSSDGIYKPYYDLNVTGGNTYELFAEVNGKVIYSITRVPNEPEVTAINNANYNFLEANIKAHPDEVYGSFWFIKTSPNSEPSFKSLDYHSIVGASNLNQNLAFTRTTDIPDELKTSYFLERLYIQVAAFDKAYKEFFKTKDNNQPIDDVFAQGGGPINWNIQGENVIGLFIGRANSKIFKSN